MTLLPALRLLPVIVTWVPPDTGPRFGFRSERVRVCGGKGRCWRHSRGTFPFLLVLERGRRPQGLIRASEVGHTWLIKEPGVTSPVRDPLFECQVWRDEFRPNPSLFSLLQNEICPCTHSETFLQRQVHAWSTLGHILSSPLLVWHSPGIFLLSHSTSTAG